MNKSFHYLAVISFLFFQKQVSSQQTHINYVGSSTIGNFINDAAKVYSNSIFSLDLEPESAGGEKAIIEGTSDLSGVANIPSASTLSKGVVSTLIGYDAIAVIVNEKNPVRNLTLEQLRGIFTGKIKNWNELGGPDLTILPYIVDIESATHKVFRSVVLGQENYALAEMVAPDSAIIEKIKSSPGSIGHISFSFLKNTEGIKTPTIDGQQISLTNKEYPITRPLYLLWWSGRRDINQFVEWVLSPEGQRLLMKRFVGLWEGAVFEEKKTGTLIVYTETYPVEDGGTFYYPHYGYALFNSNHQLVKNVTNHLSFNDEAPTKVHLPTGNYIIVPENSQNPKKEYYVKVTAGLLTKIKIQDQPANTSNTFSNIKVEKSSHEAENQTPAQFHGDFRLRAAQDIRADDNRFRGRFRLRMGLNANISPSIILNFRATTTANPDNPNTPYADFDDGFNNVLIVIDRAFIHLKPKNFNQFNLWLGKFPNPFNNSSVFSELIWDADIQPDGAAFSVAFNQSGNLKQVAFINGSYLLNDFRTNKQRYWMQSNQLNLNFYLNPDLNLKLSTGYNLYPNLKNQKINDTPFDGNAGNSVYEKLSVVQKDTLYTMRYKTGFMVNNNFAILEWARPSQPIIFKCQYFINHLAENKNKGWSIGASYGDLKKAKQYKLYYQYQYIEQDALFTMHAQDDFLSTSSFKGHVFGFAYNFFEKISLHVWGLMDNKLSSPKQKEHRWRIDLNVKI